MAKNIDAIKNFLLDILFPKLCLGCSKEGTYLCEDCLSLIGVLEHQFCPHCQNITADGKTCKNCRRFTKLNGLYFAASYQNNLAKQLIHQLKYEPYFAKELVKPLANLIITHFSLLDKKPDFSDFMLIPSPVYKKRLKWRGFNQAEEIAKELSVFLNTPLLNNVLVKTKETLPQIELSGAEREENIKNAFSCLEPEKIRGKKILLVDDVYTSGATMEECARLLKTAGAKEVWGAAVARG